MIPTRSSISVLNYYWFSFVHHNKTKFMNNMKRLVADNVLGAAAAY